jgi:signal transduction histidine kinase
VRKLRRHEIERDLIARLQETLEMRRQFVNSISHELRTPLACISGFSTTLLTYWERLDADSMRSSVEKIQRHSEDLTTLVDALLDFGTVEHGRFKADIVPLDLRPEVDAIIEGYGPLLGDHTVETDVPQVKVMADPELLRRIFVNLFSNSVKASAEGSTIRVKGTKLDGKIRLEVVDQGHGLSAEDKARVFEPFWRSAHSVKAAHRGTGIGLALVREYVRSMGGDIGVESEPDAGASFFFHLPLAD